MDKKTLTQIIKKAIYGMPVVVSGRILDEMKNSNIFGVKKIEETTNIYEVKINGSSLRFKCIYCEIEDLKEKIISQKQGE